MRRPFSWAIRAAARRSSRSASCAPPTESQMSVFSSTIDAKSSVLSRPGSSSFSDSAISSSTDGESASVSASRIITSSSTPTENGGLSPNLCSIKSRRLNAYARRSGLPLERSRLGVRAENAEHFQRLKTGGPGQASGPPVSAPASRAGNGCWRGSAAPGVRGLPGRSARRWLPSELDVESQFLGAAIDHEGDRLARVLRRDQVAELVDRAQRDPVRRDDQVTADRPAFAGDDSGIATRAEPGSSRTAAGLHGGDQQAAPRGEPEEPSDLGRDRLRGDADKGVLDLSLLDH